MSLPRPEPRAAPARAGHLGTVVASGPIRSCVGCRRRRPQHELRRIARLPDGRLVPGRQLPGRGAWLCGDSQACLEVALRRRAFGRAFRAPVTAEDAAGLVEELGFAPGARRG